DRKRLLCAGNLEPLKPGNLLACEKRDDRDDSKNDEGRAMDPAHAGTLPRAATCLGELFARLVHPEGVRLLTRHAARELADERETFLSHLFGDAPFSD